MKADTNAGKITAKQQKAKGIYKGSSIDSSLVSKKAYWQAFSEAQLQRQGEARWTVAPVQIQHTLGSSFYRALKTSSSLQSLRIHVDFESHWPGLSVTKILLRLLCSGYPQTTGGKKPGWVIELLGSGGSERVQWARGWGWAVGVGGVVVVGLLGVSSQGQLHQKDFSVLS